MTTGFPRLLGDIGGTNARWGWQDAPGAALTDVRSQPCAASPGVLESAQAYLASGGHPRPAWAGIGIATAVTGDTVRMTNSPWAFSIAELRRGLGVERCLVVNDFTALALSLPVLTATDRRALGGGAAVAGAPLALLGPGTGLGVSGLVPDAHGRLWPLAGEGGHVTLAAADDEEAQLLALLRARFGHVSAERVLSGPGLVNLYEACCAHAGRAPAAPSAAAIVDAAAPGAGHDAEAARALRQFSAFLGNVAGNLALTMGARGGVYVGGGIVPRLGALFDETVFRSRFEAKGRFADYLGAIPIWLITAPCPALLGASQALDVLPG